MFSFNKVNTALVLTNHISVHVAFEYSGNSMQYIRRLLRNEKITAMMIGQLWLIDKDSLDSYLKQAQKSKDNRYGPK